MSKAPGLLPAFATLDEQGKIIRMMRLLHDDIAELSGTLGVLVALSRRSGDEALRSALNKAAVFWNSVLAGQQTSLFVTIGRIHDTARDAYLKGIIKFVKKSKGRSALTERFGALLTAHETLIKKRLRLRQNVFAHSNFQRPEHIAFGFDDITWDQLVAYWRDIANAAELLERSIFAGDYQPKMDPNMLEDDIRLANEVFDALRALG